MPEHPGDGMPLGLFFCIEILFNTNGIKPGPDTHEATGT